MALLSLRSLAWNLYVICMAKAHELRPAIRFFKRKAATFDDPTGFRLWSRLKSVWKNFHMFFLSRQINTHYHRVEKLKA